jgi:hypothetical protein
MFWVAVYLYHLPLAPAFPVNPHNSVGAAPFSAVKAGAVVVELSATVSAVAQLDCALAKAILNNNTRTKVFFFILFY